MLTAYSHYCRMPEAPALEDREVRSAAADVNQRDTELLLVLCKDGLGCRKLLDDGIDDRDSRPVDARDDVL